ncbi:unnamed protein product [Citrullus colocynthis]|uniref:Uncharacterized protein n=1 Tax=Citrullus colocynthis TaxID=252529 RepID=A0ABP0XS10_9ROSI
MSRNFEQLFVNLLLKLHYLRNWPPFFRLISLHSHITATLFCRLMGREVQLLESGGSRRSQRWFVRNPVYSKRITNTLQTEAQAKIHTRHQVCPHFHINMSVSTIFPFSLIHWIHDTLYFMI